LSIRIFFWNFEWVFFWILKREFFFFHKQCFAIFILGYLFISLGITSSLLHKSWKGPCSFQIFLSALFSFFFNLSWKKMNKWEKRNKASLSLSLFFSFHLFLPFFALFFFFGRSPFGLSDFLSLLSKSFSIKTFWFFSYGNMIMMYFSLSLLVLKREQKLSVFNIFKLRNLLWCCFLLA